MKSKLITSQNEIRLLKSHDFKEFHGLINDNRHRLEDFFAGIISKTKTLQDTMNYCNQVEEDIKKKTYFPYLILNANTERMIGFIDVKNIDWNIPKAELGAFIDSNYEGKGFVTKNLALIIEAIVQQHGFKKLYCRVSSENTRSINVVLNSGFQLEGTIRRDYKTTSGKIIDLNYYGKLF